MNTNYFALLLLALILLSFNSFSQNNSLGLGTSTPDLSSILELKSTNQGLLIPRMTTVQITSIPSPALGLIVYNTEDNCFWFYKISEWKKICNTDDLYSSLSLLTNKVDSSLAMKWDLRGNTNVDASTDFIGSLNNADFKIFSNSIEGLRIKTNGDVGVGTFQNIKSKFHVNGGSILFDGSTGNVSESGAGTRFMWIPSKISLRAGKVTGTHWDDSNIGWGSIGLGYNVIAKGQSSIAIGDNCQSNTSGDITIGLNNISNNAGVAIGYNCRALANGSVAIGMADSASGNWSTAIGYNCKAIGQNSLAMLQNSRATGIYSVAIGYNMTASGNNSVAFGSFGSTNNYTGSFILADAGDNVQYVSSTADNQMSMRFQGGYNLYSDLALTNGVSLAPGGGSWASVSDKNLKENIKNINLEDILTGISKLQISEWSYIAQRPDDKVNKYKIQPRHIGPMAQDFYSIFGLGEFEDKITSSDIDGVNMVAIQALEKRTKDMQSKIDELTRVIEELQKKLNK